LPAHVRLTVGANGRGGIVVDGVDMSGCVRAININSEAGNPTVVILTLVANVEVVASEAALGIAHGIEVLQDDKLIDVTPLRATQREYKLGKDIAV
jgi:hypothetical protein